MKLSSYLRSARRHWIRAVVVALVAALLGAVASIALNRTTYVASATVTMRPVGLVQGDPAGQAALGQLSAGISVLLTSARVLSPAGDGLDPKVPGGDLAKSLTVRAPAQSLVITAQVSALSKDRAEATMKAVLDQFDKAVQEGALKGGVGDLRLEVASRSIVTEEAAGSALGKMSTVLVALLTGLLVGLLYLLSKVALDDTIWTAADLADVTDDSVVAVLSSPSDAGGVRALVDVLDFLVPGPGNRTLAFSPIVGAASSATIARGVSDALGAAAVLVDLDLRARPLGEQGPGVAEILAGRQTAVDVGRLLPAGGPVPNPGELLSRDALGTLLADLSSTRPWVIANTAPLVDTSEGMLAARRAGALLAVVDVGRTTRTQVQEALNVLRAGGALLAGFIMTGREG